MLPDGFKTARVRNSLDDLQDQLEALVELIQQVEQQVPQAGNRVRDHWSKVFTGLATQIHNSPCRHSRSSAMDSIIRQRCPSSRNLAASSPETILSSIRLNGSIVIAPRPANYVVTVTNPNNESATLPITVTSSGAHINRRVTVNI